jgi:PAS domain S-box-containing protein
MGLFSKPPKNKAVQEDIETGFILNTIEDGVVMVTADGIVHLFNPAASRISGWPPQEAIGLNYKNILQLIDSKGQPIPEAAHPFTQALATGKTVRDSDAIMTGKSGQALPISLIVSPVLNPNGQPTGNVVGVFRDIAKEKGEEAQRSDFISTASHEMRTPLAAIEGYLSLALNPKTAQIDANAKGYLEKAASSTKHLGDLFRDLLTSSKAEDGRLISYPRWPRPPAFQPRPKAWNSNIRLAPITIVARPFGRYIMPLPILTVSGRSSKILSIMPSNTP